MQIDVRPPMDRLSSVTYISPTGGMFRAIIDKVEELSAYRISLIGSQGTYLQGPYNLPVEARGLIARTYATVEEAEAAAQLFFDTYVPDGVPA